jgi:hypothetical protein
VSGMLRIVACVSAFDLRLTLGRAAPGRNHESRAPFHHLLERVVAVCPFGCAPREYWRPFRTTSAATSVEERPEAIDTSAHGDRTAFSRVSRRAMSTCDSRCPSDQFPSRRGTPRSSPLRKLPAGTLVALIERHANSGISQLLADLEGTRQDGFGASHPGRIGTITT